MREMYFWYQMIDINEYNTNKPHQDRLQQFWVLQIPQNTIFSFFGTKMETSDVWTNVKVHTNPKIPYTVTQKNRLIELNTLETCM